MPSDKKYFFEFYSARKDWQNYFAIREQKYSIGVEDVLPSRKRCEICSKLTIKTLERQTYFTTFSRVSIIDIEQANVSWVIF